MERGIGRFDYVCGIRRLFEMPVVGRLDLLAAVAVEIRFEMALGVRLDLRAKAGSSETVDIGIWWELTHSPRGFSFSSCYVCHYETCNRPDANVHNRDRLRTWFLFDNAG